MITADPLTSTLAQAGDERAFRELLELHRRALDVHGVPDARLTSQDAEDIVPGGS